MMKKLLLIIAMTLGCAQSEPIDFDAFNMTVDAGTDTTNQADSVSNCPNQAVFPMYGHATCPN